MRHYLLTIALGMLVSCAAKPALDATKEEPTDTQINAAVEADMLFDSSVPSNEIDVTTTDGIVTLTGTVPNILAKERAATIIEAVRGVRAVVNDIVVTPIARTDEEVRGDAEAALLSDPATEAYEVNTAVNDGVVTLSGTVQSWQEKQLSASVAKGVKGVKALKNDLTVTYRTVRSETEIAADVKAALKRDVWVDDLLIDVAVTDGTVKLTGTVGSAAEKNRAYWDAWTAGVMSVDDAGLNVEPWAKDRMEKASEVAIKSDGEILAAVKDVLLFDPRVLSFNPTVAVNGGVVTLTGTVDNLKAKRAAEQDARNTTGVWRVKNYLKVRSETTPPDDQIAQNVRDALLRDPYVDRYEIAVTALDGLVYLTGVVDSTYEKTHAEDVATRVNGVMMVNNNLTVSYPAYSYYYWPYSSSYYEPYYYNRPPAYSTWPSTSDAEVKDDIEDELFWSPFVDSDEVAVAVSNGVATLTGTVDSWSEYNSAVENAWEGGARDVIGNLTVK